MVLVKHVIHKFVRKNCNTGYCEDISQASKFHSVFEAMKYLYTQDEDDITKFNFIDDSDRNDRKR